MFLVSNKTVEVNVNENGTVVKKNITVDKYMNTVFKNLGVYEKELSIEQYQEILSTAQNTGEKRNIVLGKNDLKKDDIKQLAEAFSYNEFYDITFKDDNLILTIKKADGYRYPSAATIKKDFLDGKSDILLGKGEEHPNAEVFQLREPALDIDTGHIDYNEAVFEAGDKLVIPIKEVVIKDVPSNKKDNWWNAWREKN